MNTCSVAHEKQFTILHLCDRGPITWLTFIEFCATCVDRVAQNCGTIAKKANKCFFLPVDSVTEAIDNSGRCSNRLMR